MAINTKQARKEAEHKRAEYFDNYIARLCFLFNNAVEITDLPNELPKRYLLRVLRNKGAIAYDKITQLFLPFVEKGIDVYGLPLEYTLIGFNGYVITRKPEEVVILRANDLKFPIINYFEQQVEKLVDIDMAIEQNLDAIRTMTIAEVSDEASLLSLTNEYQARRVGSTIVYKNKNTMQGTEIKVSSTGAEFLIDKLLEARKHILNETLSSIGINIVDEKKERMQNGEIRASQNYSLDCLNTLIETFNYDAKLGGLKMRMKGKTALFTQIELDKLLQEKELKGDNPNEKN